MGHLSLNGFKKRRFMENYFNYFTEVEEYFQQKRGSGILLSTLDWALIDTWREAGIPLAIVFRGIDATFEKWEKRRSKTRRVNALAYCVQEVQAALEEQSESRVGAPTGSPGRPDQQELFSKEELVAYFDSARSIFSNVILQLQSASPQSADVRGSGSEGGILLRDPKALARDFERIDSSLGQMAEEIKVTAGNVAIDFEQLERRLGILEEKLLGAIRNSLEDRVLEQLETESERALGPYKRNMRAEMISTLRKQFIQKRLLEMLSLPRLSLFHLQGN
ncbi:MAG: hypothetical protein PHX83_17715 [Acidobacteriia bacterium]|nr:hypothetical protein [Terriglobia bacterium]